MQACITPDDADCPRHVAHRNTREVVHREAVIAWDEGGIYRKDIDRLAGYRTTAGRGRGQWQAGEWYVIQLVLHGDTAAVDSSTERTEDVSRPVELVRHVDVTCIHVDSWVSTLALATEITRSNHKVWTGRQGIATIVTDRCGRRTEITNGKFDLPIGQVV